MLIIFQTLFLWVQDKSENVFPQTALKILHTFHSACIKKNGKHDQEPGLVFNNKFLL